MIVGIARERQAGENRVALTPDQVSRVAKAGHQVVVEPSAGDSAGFPDAAYQQAGAQLQPDVLSSSDILLKVQAPSSEEVRRIKEGATLIGLLQPATSATLFGQFAERRITAFAMELMPRITRAQTMDILSSQANLAGYKAVIIAANLYGRFMPMLMTAAGTVKAARVLILGVGVAGLQAIATAKRLGAVIEASDVRPSVRDQVESLGGKWVDVPYANDDERKIAEGVGGYARPMPPEWMTRQAEVIAERCRTVDILITTALIPGRPAPKLIKADTVASMKSGAVIVDLAVEQGGNVEGSQLDQIVAKDGVRIVGFANLPARVPADASALYARNVLNFLALSLNAKTGDFAVPRDDEIIKATLVCENGAIVPRS
jgi:NAD(P) transhydrogenase subunit alpha